MDTTVNVTVEAECKECGCEIAVARVKEYQNGKLTAVVGACEVCASNPPKSEQGDSKNSPAKKPVQQTKGTSVLQGPENWEAYQSHFPDGWFGR